VITTINREKKVTPPLPKQIPKRFKVCSEDCLGPLESPYSEGTCSKPCDDRRRYRRSL